MNVSDYFRNPLLRITRWSASIWKTYSPNYVTQATENRFESKMDLTSRLLDDGLAPVAKLTDSLNRASQDEHQRSSTPVICGKAYFLIRNKNYAAALELLLTAEPEDGRK